MTIKINEKQFEKTINQIIEQGFASYNETGYWVAGDDGWGYTFNKNALKVSNELFASIAKNNKLTLSFSTFKFVLFQEIVNNIKDNQINSKDIYDNLNSRLSNITQEKYTLCIPISGVRVDGTFALFEYRILNKNSLLKKFKKLSTDNLTFNRMPESVAIVTAEGDKEALEIIHKQNIERCLNWIRCYAIKYSKHLPNIYVGNNSFQSLSMITFDSKNRNLTSDEQLNTSHFFNLSLLKQNKKFKKYIQLITMSNELTEKIESAIEWLGRFYNHNDSKCRYLYLMIGLEALFNTDVSNYSSITAIVSEKSALLFKADARAVVFERVRNLYKLRSSIVHTGSPKNATNLKEDFLLVLDIIEKYMDLVIKEKFTTQDIVNDYFFNYKLRI